MPNPVDFEDTPTAENARDEWIVVRCQLGERAAFDALIERWHPPLWRYVVRMTGDADAAADLVQDVWLRVLRGLASLRDASRFRPWLFGIARRALMDRLRQRYAEPPTEPLDLSSIEEPAADDDRSDESALVLAELDQLPLAEREVLVLFYLRELNLSDIAAIAAVPVGTVKSRLFRARKILRRQLARKGMDR